MIRALTADERYRVHVRVQRMWRRVGRANLLPEDAIGPALLTLEYSKRVDWIGEREAGDYGRASGLHRAPAGKRALRHCVDIFYRGYGPLPGDR